MDKYTKSILTVIAFCLMVIVYKGSFETPAYAESNFRHVKNQEQFRADMMAANKLILNELNNLKSICK